MPRLPRRALRAVPAVSYLAKHTHTPPTHLGKQRASPSCCIEGIVRRKNPVTDKLRHKVNSGIPSTQTCFRENKASRLTSPTIRVVEGHMRICKYIRIHWCLDGGKVIHMNSTGASLEIATHTYMHTFIFRHHNKTQRPCV